MATEMDVSQQSKIHLLDVGAKEYGDAVLCQFGNRTVLIDGAHPGDEKGSSGHRSIPAQLGQLVGSTGTIQIDLLIVTHAHQDHIGCLPRMIADESIKFGWALVADPSLGWGRGEGENRDSLAEDERILKLAAGLREEVLNKRTIDDAEILEFLTDAATLESRYVQMLENLEQQGTRVVRYGRDNIVPLTKEFADIKLKILGPTTEHLLMCADIINLKTRDSLQRATDVFTRDTAIDEANAYRQLISQNALSQDHEADALDAKSRPGPAINLQSIVSQFEYGGHKFLFAGDFQFARTEVSSKEIETSVRRLRKVISRDAPYSFVKLSHHGSDNAFSEEIYEELGGTQYFGLCAGEESTHHPNRKVLELLNEHRNDIQWARTDHNGLATLIFTAGSSKPKIELSQGELNDSVPNDRDILTEPVTNKRPAQPSLEGKTETSHSSSSSSEETAVAESSESTTKSGMSKSEEIKTIQIQQNESPNFIEFSAKVPHIGTRIRFSGDFSIEIEPANTPSHKPNPKASIPIESESKEPIQPERDGALVIGGGRAILRELFFVTSREALTANIGRVETEEILAALKRQHIPYYAELPRHASSAAQIVNEVRRELVNRPKTKGVVILGGYDVVPSQILDCLPSELRRALHSNEDPDNFVVWNDEVYGDIDGDGLPELPVSRIPDGKSADLVFTALMANHPNPGNRRFGIRNIARPFAKTVFQTLPGTEIISISRDTVFNQHPPLTVEADQVYLMLHGDYTDGSRFWGEGTPQNREAFNVSNLPEQFKGVVFTGCCWGALTVNTPAGLTAPNRPFGQKTTESSIALSFLARGATAFVGCTGAHYSPIEPPYNYFGGPMHVAFWRHYNAGAAPAEALFQAKVEYIREMPHGRTSAIQTAIEYKILRQYTCLGLGW